jgi:hypothetical protein
LNRIALGCVALLFVGDVFAADFGGAWDIAALIGGKPSAIHCTLQQKGEVLTGTCKPAQFDPSEVTGTVAGANARWSYDVAFNGNTNHVEYEAVLGADGTLGGTLHLGPMPVPFTAVRE